MDKIKDNLWELESIKFALEEDINFLNCVEENLLSEVETKENVQYLYWQLKSMVQTLRKSMTLNNNNFMALIDKITNTDE